MEDSITNPKDSPKPKDNKVALKDIIPSKNVKTTSRLAIASGISTLLGFFSVILAFLLGHIFLGIVFISLFLIAACILSVIALVVILLGSEQLRGCGWAIASLVLAGTFLLYLLLPGLHKMRETSRMDVCKANLQQLGAAIIAYADDHDGYLPIKDKWCDLLMKYDNISEETFKCPLRKRQICSYAFNKDLEGLRLRDVPNNALLVFEANGDWNLSGGAELLNMRHRGIANVLLPDGHVISCRREDIVEYPFQWKNNH